MNEFLNELRLFRKKIINDLIQIKLSQRHKDFFHQTIVPNATYSPWKTDREFLETFNVAKKNTLVDIYRAYNLWSLVKQTNQLEGSILEVGVWKGGTACIIAKAAIGNSKIFLADTFQGVVKTGLNDTYYKGGEHSDSGEDEVKELLNGLGLDNYEILTGIFPDDFKGDYDDTKFRFCHIDVDVYQSALDIFNFVWSRLIIGGIVVFDDYGFLGCEGVTKLVNELIIENGIKMYNINGHAVIIKCA